jgi:hypothetical protein
MSFSASDILPGFSENENHLALICTIESDLPRVSGNFSSLLPD